MIFDRLLQTRSLENPSTSLSDPANWLFEAFGAQPTASQVVVTEKNATQITAYWSALNTISDTLAELPIKLVRVNRDGITKDVGRHHTLPLLRLQPNPMMTAMTAKATCQAHSLGWGNGFQWIKRNRMGEAVELWPLMPNATRAYIDDSKKLWFDTQLDIGATRIDADDVIHVPALSRNGIMGMSIIAEQREILGSVIATQRFGSKFFANGARPSGLISYPGKVRDKDKIRESIERAVGGENHHGVLVLSEDARWSNFSVPPEDAQFLGTRELGVDEIGRMFRLPLHFLNKMGQATFNNLEQMGTHFAQYTMMPWIVRWEQELTRKLLTESEIRRGYRYKFNLAALMRGDIKTRSEVYSKAVQFGWMTRNEVRALEDMNPIDGLDDPLVPLNLGVVGEENEPMPDPEPAEPEPGNEPDDDESEEETDDRTFLILTSAMQRLANKEARAIERITSKQVDADRMSDDLVTFWRGHQALLVENLAMTKEDAEQLCKRHATELAQAMDEGTLTDLLTRWTTTEVMTVVNQISTETAQ